MSHALIDPSQVASGFQFAVSTPLGRIYLAGMAASVVAHATFKGAQSFTAWRQNRGPTNDNGSETEEALSAVLSGIGWGFLRGCFRSPIWPVELISLAAVLALKSGQK